MDLLLFFSTPAVSTVIFTLVDPPDASAWLSIRGTRLVGIPKSTAPTLALRLQANDAYSVAVANVTLNISWPMPPVAMSAEIASRKPNLSVFSTSKCYVANAG